MTVIAWDGKTLAADKLGDACGLRRTTTKIHRFDGGLFGCAGTASKAAEMLDWIRKGADPATVPAFQLTDEYQDVFVVRNDGRAFMYGRSGYPFEVEDECHAIGSGRDFAIATMFLGWGAHHAVFAASQFETGCGNGIDTLEL